MIRTLLAAFAIPLLATSADDSIRLFQSCAYTLTLPSRSGASKPEVEFLIQSANGSNSPIPPDHIFRSGEKITLSVASRREGYFYLFQDPPDPQTLVFPAKADDNHLVKDTRKDPVVYGLARPVRLAFSSTRNVTVLLGVAPQPIPNVGQMSAAQVRQYFQEMLHCRGPVFLERTLAFQR